MNKRDIMNNIIINADDFGISENVNLAVAKCFNYKFIDRTSIIMNMPSTGDAIAISRRYGFNDRVGLHLNLTEGKKMNSFSLKTKLYDEDGYFTNYINKSQVPNFFIDPKTAKSIAIETETQIIKYLDAGFTLKHIDSHQHVHTKYKIFTIIRPILIKYGFNSIRISRNIPIKDIIFYKQIYKYFFNTIVLKPNTKKYFFKTTKYMGSQNDYFKFCKKHIIDGTTEIMTHPFLNNENEICDGSFHIKISDIIKRKLLND